MTETPLSNAEELSILKAELKKTISKTPLEISKFKKKKFCYLTGKYLPRSAHKVSSGIRYDSKSIWNRKSEKICECVLKEVKSTVMVSDSSVTIEIAPFISPNFKDTVISTVFERNQNKWNDALIVQDVTGSMAPYTYQTMLWHAMNEEKTRAKEFCFFNDGDSRPDGPIGQSGGVYSIHTSSSEAVQRACISTMSKGNGGRSPENNIEALLYAITKSPDSKEIIMIADNWAPVRDIFLLDQVDRPVHVIICGSYNGLINIDYLNIAYATGGSIHTIEKDLEDFSKMKEGEVLQINDQKFKIQSDRFVQIR